MERQATLRGTVARRAKSRRVPDTEVPLLAAKVRAAAEHWREIGANEEVMGWIMDGVKVFPTNLASVSGVRFGQNSVLAGEQTVWMDAWVADQVSRGHLLE